MTQARQTVGQSPYTALTVHIENILCPRSVSQIRYAIIRWITVDVQDFHPLGASTQKCQGYKLMNRPSIFSMAKYNRQMTSSAVNTRLQNVFGNTAKKGCAHTGPSAHHSSETFDTSKGAGLIFPFIARNISPFFCEGRQRFTAAPVPVRRGSRHRRKSQIPPWRWPCRPAARRRGASGCCPAPPRCRGCRWC